MPDGKPENCFAFNEEFKDKVFLSTTPFNERLTVADIKLTYCIFRCTCHFFFFFIICMSCDLFLDFFSPIFIN